MLRSEQYDFIFLGAGCASLSIIMRMIHSGAFRDKKVLLIDRDSKIKNDRTWCLWETTPGFFQNLVCKEWDKLEFLGDSYSGVFDIAPYKYKMIRGVDFYTFCFDRIREQGNIELVKAEADTGVYHNEGIQITINGKPYNLGHAIVFNSILSPDLFVGETKRLLQHFKGWVIETPTSNFDNGKARLMDFRVDQKQGTTFCYVLPLSDKRALIEHTLFTRKLLSQEEYDEVLKDYIGRFLGIDNYTIVEKEYGVIPMTNAKLSFDRGDGVFHIGTAGGQTKASSGYTFQFIQKQSQQIVECLMKGESLYSLPEMPKRFRFYDNTLLEILYHNKLPAGRIFGDLFKKNKPQQVLRFLDNESSFIDELKIISSLPTWPFLKAAIKQF